MLEQLPRRRTLQQLSLRNLLSIVQPFGFQHPTMRLSYILAVATAALFAVCDAASATTLNELSQPATNAIPTVDVAAANSPVKRSLRSVEDDEERGVEVLAKLLPAKKLVSKDGKTLSGSFVKKLLKNEAYREKTFRSWAQGDIDGTFLRTTLGNLDKKGRVELLNRYTAFLGSRDGLVVHRPGPL
jgi:hypothetical protein